MTRRPQQVAIIGAGIAGLTAALALARKGIAVDLHERAEALREVGAGLQLSPNASRILDALDVLPALRSVWLEPRAVALVDGKSLRTLTEIACGAAAERRWGAPYGTLHRATLQGALADAVGRQSGVTLHLGTTIDPALPSKDLAPNADLVIGADGVWSGLRGEIAGAGRAAFSGSVAFRITVPMTAAPRWIHEERVSAFVGPGAHLVAYPLREAGAVNLVAIVSGLSAPSRWDSAADAAMRSTLIRAFSRWHPDIAGWIAAEGQGSLLCWPLYGVSEGRWFDGERRVLIGDAAHAMTPFAAQGAAMAIEDAWELAEAVASDSGTLTDRLSGFETARRVRVARVRDRGAFNSFAYHARGPVRFARDIVFGLTPPARLAAGLDWLYGYRAPGL
ncbi:salicylate hydroxylase [Rhizobium sp. RU20A]|uniref:FAD-dependent monooxygenase n=1 Tax=Rhizobium sp. RU20A TaxID=1907412 RepID=UPI000953A24B|nr:FAD-dependent monooxygenase [Rhizobium sp. RU20A]SIQ00580.1 salicylate hydroxylase [Rhizobium sp. RU20A]